MASTLQGAGKKDGNYKTGLFAISDLDGNIVVPLKANPITGALLVQNPGGVGFGDVAGPGSSTQFAITTFAGTTGKVLRNTNVLIDGSDNITGVESITINNLGVSQIVKTDASKKLVSEAEGTAFNKNFGTGSGQVAEGNHTHAANSITSGTLDDARLSSNVTLQGNTFNIENSLVKLNASGYFVLGATAAGTSKIQLNSSIRIGDSSDLATAAPGVIRYHDGMIEYSDGNTWNTLGVSGAGLTSLNGVIGASQTFAIGTSGDDFNISSVESTHTFNIPSASATKRGLLSSADWSTFNAKQDVLTRYSVTSATSGVTIGGTGKVMDGDITITIGNSSASTNGLLSSADWSTFNAKANAVHTHSAADITSGTLDDARLSSNILRGSNNLADLTNATMARSQLGLGSLATQNGVFAGDISGTFGIDKIEPSVTADQMLVTVDVLGTKETRWVNTSTLTDAAAITTGTLADARLSANVTLEGNTFNSASKLVKLDASNKLPAVDGSLLTSLNVGAVTSGILGITNGGTGLGTAGTGNQILGMNLAGNAYEYKSLIEGVGIQITHSAGGITITNTGASGTTSGTIVQSGSTVTYNDTTNQVLVQATSTDTLYTETYIQVKDKGGNALSIESITGTYDDGTHSITYSNGNRIDGLTGVFHINEGKIAYLDQSNVFTGAANLFEGTTIFEGSVSSPIVTFSLSSGAVNYDTRLGNIAKLTTSGNCDITFDYTSQGGVYTLFLNNTSNHTINLYCKKLNNNGTTSLINMASLNGVKPAVSVTGTYVISVIVAETSAHTNYFGPTATFTN